MLLQAGQNDPLHPQPVQSVQGPYLCKNSNLLIGCQSLERINFTSLIVNSFGDFWQFWVSEVLCNSTIDRTFAPLSLQTLSQLSTLGHFPEPPCLTLRTACSSPETQLLLQGLISLLWPLFSFSVETRSKSAFYSERYTGVCHVFKHCDVEVGAPKRC